MNSVRRGHRVRANQPIAQIVDVGAGISMRKSWRSISVVLLLLSTTVS
jgi:hypothetical protein